MPRLARRETLELYRDLLLLLAFQSPMKRTPLMYGLYLSWTAYKSLEDDVAKKKLIRKISMEGLTRKEMNTFGADSRNLYLIEITEKGKVVLRWLDAMLQYINDSTPNVLPPVWVLNSIFRRRAGIDPLQLEQPLYLQVLPGKLEFGGVELSCVFWISGHRIFHKGEGRDSIAMGIHCPECGQECAGPHGLKIHITKKHPENREKILEDIRPYLEKKGLK